MSDSNPAEIAELAAKAEELQRSLDTVARRLDQIRDRQGATVVIPRPAAWWKQPVVVGVLSSAATALVIGGLAGLASSFGGPEPAAKPPPAPMPVAVTPPPAAVPCEAPAPPPTPAEARPPAVPRPPRTETVPPPPPTSGPHGFLTVVCLPAKCVDIVDNGVSIGPSHVFSRPTTAGRHNLVLKGGNGTTKNVNVEVVADQLKDVRMFMGDANATNTTPSYL